MLLFTEFAAFLLDELDGAPAVEDAVLTDAG